MSKRLGLLFVNESSEGFQNGANCMITNPCACFSSLLINILCGILFLDEGNSLALKTFSGTYPFSLMIFFMAWHLGTHLLPLSRSCFSFYIDMFYTKHLSKIIKPSFAGIKFSSFRSYPSFAFKLS